MVIQPIVSILKNIEFGKKSIIPFKFILVIHRIFYFGVYKTKE